MIKVATPIVGEEEINAVVQVLKSGNYTSSQNVEQFEKDFANYVNTKYAVACNSGTAALHMALLSLKISQGDEIIVPSMTFFATISAVLMVGATPIFSDIDYNGNIDVHKVEGLITDKTKAIIPVHYFGMPCNIETIMKISKQYNLYIIEDCAQAHGASVKGKKVGSFGHVNCFSFFATKNMTTIEGGIITTNNPYIYDQCNLYRSHGMTDRDTHTILGYNYRMNEISGAIGKIQLKKLDLLNKRRIEISHRLYEGCKSNIFFSPLYGDSIYNENIKCVFFWFPIVFREKELTQKFLKFLKKNDIEYRFRYNNPLYNQPIFKNGYKNTFLPMAEMLSGCVVGLPNHPNLTNKEVDFVIKTVTTFKG